MHCVLWLQGRSCFAPIWFPDSVSVERFSLVWVLRLGVLSLGVWGVVFLLVVRCLGKYYSYVGRQISPSLSLGAWARLVLIGYYLQRSCPSDYIRHIHHAFIIIFETRNTGCCYGHALRLARSPPHGTSFGWFVFLSSHPIPPIVSRACILHPEETARFLHHLA